MCRIFCAKFFFFFFLGLLFHTVCVCVRVHWSDLDIFLFVLFLFSLVLISLAEDLSFNAIFFIAFKKLHPVTFSTLWLDGKLSNVHLSVFSLDFHLITSISLW